LFCT
jgi:hypothetical protein